MISSWRRSRVSQLCILEVEVGAWGGLGKIFDHGIAGGIIVGVGFSEGQIQG